MANKSLGQHFLKNGAVAKNILDTLAPGHGDVIFEIGPGNGELTVPLSKKCAEVGYRIIAIEKDIVLADRLRQQMQKGVDIIEGDVLTVLPEQFAALPPAVSGEEYKIVGNIPYYLTGHLLRILSELKHRPGRCVFMVQKEVGLRICAQTNDSDYGYYSLLCQYYAAAKPLFGVAPSSFSPPPDVDSLVINLSNKNSLAPPAGVFDLIKQAFAHRRKNVLNAFTISTTRDKAAFKHLLEKAAISPLARPQNLAWKDYQALQELLTTL